MADPRYVGAPSWRMAPSTRNPGSAPDSCTKRTQLSLFTVRNSSCRKVMFSQMSVCLSTEEEVYTPVADPEGRRGRGGHGPVKISHKKDGCRFGRIDFMFLPPLTHPLLHHLGRHPLDTHPGRHPLPHRNGTHIAEMHSCFPLF